MDARRAGGEGSIPQTPSPGRCRAGTCPAPAVSPPRVPGLCRAAPAGHCRKGQNHPRHCQGAPRRGRGCRHTSDKDTSARHAEAFPVKPQESLSAGVCVKPPCTHPTSHPRASAALHVVHRKHPRRGNLPHTITLHQRKPKHSWGEQQRHIYLPEHSLGSITSASAPAEPSHPAAHPALPTAALQEHCTALLMPHFPSPCLPFSHQALLPQLWKSLLAPRCAQPSQSSIKHFGDGQGWSSMLGWEHPHSCWQEEGGQQCPNSWPRSSPVPTSPAEGTNTGTILNCR